MPGVVYLPAAKADLKQIWKYVAERSGSYDVADKLLDSLDDAAQAYAQQPDLGELRPDLARDLRSFRVGRYVALYLPRTDGIEVVQIIHGARDIPAHFRRRT